MKHALSIYSDILILRDETYQALKRSPGAPTFILLMALSVTLLAGCGKWLGLPYELTRPTMAENIGSLSEAVESVSQDVVPDIQESLDLLSRDNLSFALGEVLPPDELVTPEALAEVASRAGLTTGQMIALIERQVDVPAAIEAELVSRPATAAVIGDLLDATELNPAALRAILAEAQFEAIPSVVAERGRLIDVLAGGVLSGFTGNQWLQQVVTNVALTPERIRDITVRIGLDPATVSRINERVGAAPGQVQDVLEITQQELETLQPPLGVTFSRLITFLGDWLSTPFQLAATYLPLVLVALLVAKLLGGTGTVTQHIFGMALAVAPLFLMFLTFANDLGAAVPATTQYSINVAGRILGLIAIAWAFLIAVKSLSVAHEFSRWRALAVIGLTYATIYLLVPLLSFLAAGYLIRG